MIEDKPTDIVEIINQIKVNDIRAETLGFISPSKEEKAERIAHLDSTIT